MVLCELVFLFFSSSSAVASHIQLIGCWSLARCNVACHSVERVDSRGCQTLRLRRFRRFWSLEHRIMRLAASLLLLLQLLLALFCCAVVLAVYQSCRSYRWARLSDVNFSDNRIIIAHRRAHRRHLPPLLPYAGCYSCQPASAQAKLPSIQASVTHKLPSVRQFVPSSVCVCFYCFFFWLSAARVLSSHAVWHLFNAPHLFIVGIYLLQRFVYWLVWHFRALLLASANLALPQQHLSAPHRLAAVKLPV